MSSYVIISAKKKDVKIDIITLTTTPARWLRSEVAYNLPDYEERPITINELNGWIDSLRALQGDYQRHAGELKAELAQEGQMLLKAETEAAITNIRERMDDLRASIAYYTNYDNEDGTWGDAALCNKCLKALLIAVHVMKENVSDKEVEFYIYAD